jgi:hypothetical protein
MKMRLLVALALLPAFAVLSNAQVQPSRHQENPVQSASPPSGSNADNETNLKAGGEPMVGGHRLRNLRDLVAGHRIPSSIFPILHEERRWADDEENRLRNRIDELKTQVGDIPAPLELIHKAEYEERIRKINSEIDENEKKQLVGPRESDKDEAHLMLISLTRQKGALGAAWEESQKYDAQQETQQRIRDQLKSARDDKNTVTDYLLSLDDTVNSMLLTTDANNTFKTWISVAFSLLVGLVIMGFFYIATKEKTIRDAIFSNDSGLQFVTLFSLIIAIILFGVIDVLEGRELAALLGGLSGYILGRGNFGLGGGQTREAPGSVAPVSGIKPSTTT